MVVPVEEIKADVLVICAHPDDAELSCGGTIAKLTKEGRRVVVVDCTSGQLGTRGNPRTRLEEATKASQILHLAARENLGMEDGNIESSPENIEKCIRIIRQYKPEIIITHPPFERHPDHESVNRLVREANFKSGLLKIDTYNNGEKQNRHRTRKLYCFMQSYEFQQKASFYIDISDVYDIKYQSILAYQSQVYIVGKQNEDETPTRLYRPEFLGEIEARAIFFGSLIGVRYAEAFLSIEPVWVRSMSNLL